MQVQLKLNKPVIIAHNIKTREKGKRRFKRILKRF